MKASDCLQHISKNSDFHIDLSPRELKLVARCYLWLFTLYINIKIGKNSC